MSVQYYREDGMDRVLITVLLGRLHDNSATRPRPGSFGYPLSFLICAGKGIILTLGAKESEN